MEDQRPLRLCDKHTIPYAYKSDECPMCRAIREMLEEVQKAYQRGFVDGVEAGKIEAERSMKDAGRDSSVGRGETKAVDADVEYIDEERLSYDQPSSGTGKGSRSRSDKKSGSGTEHTAE